jgi:hypothetical protein
MQRTHNTVNKKSTGKTITCEAAPRCARWLVKVKACGVGSAGRWLQILSALMAVGFSVGRALNFAARLLARRPLKQ